MVLVDEKKFATVLFTEHTAGGSYGVPIVSPYEARMPTTSLGAKFRPMATLFNTRYHESDESHDNGIRFSKRI
jgi:hypothetical protein